MRKIDTPPDLEQLKKRPDVTVLELDIKDTDPVRTAGFTDAEVERMSGEGLQRQMSDLNRQEQFLHAQLSDLSKRRQDLNALLTRKSEIERNGLRN